MALKSLEGIRAPKGFNWKEFGKLVDTGGDRTDFALRFGRKKDVPEGYDYFHGNWGRWWRDKDKWNPNKWRRHQNFFKAAWDLWKPAGDAQEADTKLEDATFDPVDTSSDTPGVFESSTIENVSPAFDAGDEPETIQAQDNTEAGSSLENPPIDNTIDLDTDGIDNIGAIENSIRENQDIFLPVDQQQSSTYGNTLGYDTRQNRSNLQYGR